MKEIETIPNFFLKFYAKYLLISLPESNYKFSTSNLGKQVSKSNQRLAKLVKRISRKEATAWAHSRDRI